MKDTYVDTLTETSTAQKISMGVVVGTAMLVIVSAAAAAVYTLASNTVQSDPVVVSSESTSTQPLQLDPKADRVLKVTP